ncbi:sigma-70 family RNA polymerase sigma factor [Anaerobacillus alkaliphilus]|uniref:Sigma-70 family RNA polymerase sigma factor n=1 Tax=Anaerobacillus alkaliphilus TaxID=1548597 RepID=A0A4Q0VMJ0_9BACI|nr:sigma-70 family RNA polymerase sigma factor [Anaerobacillus alkaliphilus]RXI96561.1 sigma-70 family RNA polymerase sigma factor [Anaerobacillus alkaliphilus]
MQLEEVYKLYVNDLYRYLFSLSRDHFVAEDLVQETFFRAFLTLEDYEISNIKAWLFRVAYNAFIDRQRKNKRIVLGENMEEVTVSNVRSPEEKILEREGLDQLLEDLNSLQENEKQAILLCDLHGLQYQEAATILDLKLNTFKSHLLRGRKKLTEIVKERMRRDERR